MDSGRTARCNRGIMRSLRLRTVSVALPAALAVSCGSPGPVVDGSESLAVARLVQERLAASLAGDTATWHRQVSDQAVWTGPGLAVGTTPQALTEQAANRLLHPRATIADLAVHLVGGIAQATYVVIEAGTPGKRFRKTDTYVRSGKTWTLVGSAEVPVPFRASIPLALERRQPLLGRYHLGAVDSILVSATEPGRLVMSGPGFPPDTLYAVDDTTFFVDGDPGSWVFLAGADGRVHALAFRMAGGKDVVYTREQ
jgi:hypothetical protein